MNIIFCVIGCNVSLVKAKLSLQDSYKAIQSSLLCHVCCVILYAFNIRAIIATFQCRPTMIWVLTFIYVVTFNYYLFNKYNFNSCLFIIKCFCIIFRNNIENYTHHKVQNALHHDCNFDEKIIESKDQSMSFFE